MSITFTNNLQDHKKDIIFTIDSTIKLETPEPIKKLKFSEEGDYIVICSGTSSFKLINSESKMFVQNFKNVHLAEVSDFIILPGNKQIISSDKIGNVYLWNTLTEQIENHLTGNSFVK